jgi:cytochrome c-type biogenesis protein CcmH
MGIELMKTKYLFLLTLFTLLIVVGFLPSMVVSAQQPTPSDDEVNAIARQLYCPVCENTPLDVCPTTACHQWRELIRQMLAEGKSAGEIKQYFVDYYGARVLSEPPRTGVYWLVYIIPPLVFLVGIYLLFRAFRAWKKISKETIALASQSTSLGSETGQRATSDADTEYINRLEKELKKRE